MTRLLRVLAALLVAVALAGADGSCERRDRDVVTNRPPAERKTPPGSPLVLIKAHGRGPYTVLIIAQQVGKSGIDRTGPVHVARGEYTQTLGYASGLKINIKMTVHGHRDDLFYCQMIDGATVVDDERRGTAYCTLVTSR